MLALLFFSFIFAANPWESTVGFRKPAGCDFFTKANAVKIIGTDVTWTGTDSTANEPRKWTCTFVSKDAPEGPKLHFVLHRFTAAEAARQEFDSVVNSNKNLAGFGVGMGSATMDSCIPTERTSNS